MTCVIVETLIYYRLLAECEQNPELKDKLVIAWLREEEWRGRFLVGFGEPDSAGFSH